jgi:hypothetical protein
VQEGHSDLKLENRPFNMRALVHVIVAIKNKDSIDFADFAFSKEDGDEEQEEIEEIDVGV